MNIWNKTFQSLLFSKDLSSVRLAFALANDIEAVCSWWFMNQDDCAQLSLQEIPFEQDYVESVMYDRYQKIVLEVSNNDEEFKYVKRLYEKNNTVE